ncbi:MAG: hypothetical protein MO853_10110 [Candidatus Protistobacter heckmanni]|nr:hypothetical protein [Candidatus Protistobacter heckmanni]
MLSRIGADTVGSRFEAVWDIDAGAVVGHEARLRHAREGAVEEQEIWERVLSGADDDLLVSLDQLSSILHAVNYCREDGAGIHGRRGSLHLNAKPRLLRSVEDHHGAAFRRALDALRLGHMPVVIQLPIAINDQVSLLRHALANYQLNGFNVAVYARDFVQAGAILGQVRPDLIKLDAGGG